MNNGQATPNLGSVLRGALESHMKGVRVALPGRVESYDASTCSCSVQPLVQEGVTDETGARKPERLPVVANVPVVFPGAGGMRITFPVAVGDTVLLVFASSSIDRWLAVGGEVDPIDDRRHHITDAVAIPGLLDFVQAAARPAHTTATVLEGSDVRIGDASTAAVLALKSDVDALKTWASTHVHSGVTTGTGTSLVPTVAPPSAVGTTKTKAS